MKKIEKSQPNTLDILKKEVVKMKDSPAQAKTAAQEGMELKEIKALNEIEALKKKIDESTASIMAEMSKINAKVDYLSEQVKGVPKQTTEELKNVKGNQPLIYDKIKDVISQSVKASILDAIDTNILNIVKEAGKVNSRDLLAKAIAQQVCSKNTLYIHLKRLEDRGLLAKKRAGHEVMYALNVIEQSAPAAPAAIAQPAVVG